MGYCETHLRVDFFALALNYRVEDFSKRDETRGSALSVTLIVQKHCIVQIRVHVLAVYG
jgi:hypothetical protein